ncbi:cell adhesion molecule Dscam1-like isoform X3 [Oratosquilla oratoria]|uniref:cell adhesion molecule Dscam1-like isoform X3 n=1 Tax=Oratosquilla oratoria TaxID=337810 RepID=UPI003F773557
MVNEPRSSVPPRITDSRSSVTAQIRDTVELPCAAQGFPIPQYKWYREVGEREELVVLDGRAQQVGGSLLLRQVAASDAGRYFCVVRSSVGSEQVNTMLVVTAPLTAHITPQVQTVDVGGVATFNCSPEGFPQETLTWLKDGDPLELDERVTQPSPRTVVIRRVERADRGMYQCLVANLLDTAQGSAQLTLGDASPEWLDTSGAAIKSPGNTITLACKVRGSPPPVLSWTLHGDLVRRKNNRVFTDEVVEGDVVRGTLNISSVRMEDGGEWSCIAKNRAGTIKHTGQLYVRGPPSIRPMNPVSVVAGRPAAFNCVASGYPIERIYWEKLGVVLPIDPRQEVHANGTLEIRNVSRDADGGAYTCVATAGDQVARANLHVSVMVPPHIDEHMFQLKSGFAAGSRARIMCVVASGDLPLTFSWRHNGRPIQPGPTVTVRSLDELTSVLLFTSLRQEDGGNYTCTATNAVASDSKTAKLIVKVSPTWKEEPNDVSVVVGSDVSIPCEARGSPEPKVSWRKAEGDVPRHYRPVTTLGENVRVMSNSSLIISSIRRDQGGEFLCSASNGVGPDLSKPIKVVVKVPPQFEERVSNVSVVAGKTATLVCEAYGDLPITVIWTYGRNPKRVPSGGSSDGKLVLEETILTSSSKSPTKDKNSSSLKAESTNLPASVGSPSAGPSSTTIEEGFRSVLRVKTSSRRDSKVFACLASNVYGNDTKIVNLIVQEIPGTPGPPRVVDSGSRTINLTWSPPSHDGNAPVTSYRLLIINSTDSWANIDRIRTVEVRTNYARIKGLVPARVYHIRVVGVNAVGASPPSSEVKVTTAHEPPTHPPTNVRVSPISSTSLRVTWQPPDTSMSHRASLGYYVGYKVTNSSEPFRYQTLEPSATALYRPETTLNSLQKFTSYRVTVQAFNAAGAGPRTELVEAMTEEDVPSEPPRDVQCTSLSSTSLHVRWTRPPVSAIHGVLQGYKVIYRPVHPKKFFHPDDLSEKTVVTLMAPLLVLERYTNYSVTVAAFTRRGDGVRSDPVYCITMEDIPGPVEAVKALSVDGQSVLVSWRPPSSPNGVITKYTLHMRDTSSSSSSSSSPSASALSAGPPSATSTGDAPPREGSGRSRTPRSQMGGAWAGSWAVPGSRSSVTSNGDAVWAGGGSSSRLMGEPSGSLRMGYSQIASYPGGTGGSGSNTYGTYRTSGSGRGSSSSAVTSYTNADYTPGRTSATTWVVSGKERHYLVTGLRAGQMYSFWVTAATKVGEGPQGVMVTQRPRHDAQAAIASFSQAIVSVWGEELNLRCRVVGSPTPIRTWTFNGDSLPSSGRVQEYPDGSLLITDVKATDAGNYTCSASNVHGTDNITYAVTVQVPPSPPLLFVSDVTASTITVRWRTTLTGGAPVLGYYLHEKREFGEWRRVEVPSDAASYTFTGLQCGARYQVYISAFNHVGVSQPSDAIPTRTDGREPIVPTQSSLLRVNVTSISLNLAAWLDGGCPITSLVVEYKERGSSTWTLVSNHVKWDNTSEFVVLDLQPATHYTLRVTAHNSAGSSVATYPFTTLTHLGELIVRDLGSWGWDAHVFIAVIVACVLVFVAVVAAVLYTCRKTHTHTQQYKGKEVNHINNDLTPESGLTSDTLLGGNGIGQVLGGPNGGVGVGSYSTGRTLEILEAYTPSTLPLGSYDEISPYATFRMHGESKTPPPPPLPSPAVSVDSGNNRPKRKPSTQNEGNPISSRPSHTDHAYEKIHKGNKTKTVTRCPSISEKVNKEASGSSVTSVSSNHEELIRAYQAHTQARELPTTPESGRRNKFGESTRLNSGFTHGTVATSSEITTESDTTAEVDLVSFGTALGNVRALRVPALFKQGWQQAYGDYQTVADVVGGRSRTESTTSHEESSDEAKGEPQHVPPSRQGRTQGRPGDPIGRGGRAVDLARQGSSKPSRGEPDYSYAKPVKKAGPPPPPLSSTESNRPIKDKKEKNKRPTCHDNNTENIEENCSSACSEDAYSRRNTLEFSEAECDHPSTKVVDAEVDEFEHLKVDLAMDKLLMDPRGPPKASATAL